MERSSFLKEMRSMVVLLVLMTPVLLATSAVAQPVKVWVHAPEYREEGAAFVVKIVEGLKLVKKEYMKTLRSEFCRF